MKTLPDRLLALEALLASSATFDRRLMDRAFAMLGGIESTDTDPKTWAKLNRIVASFNELAAKYPDAMDDRKPLPATALVAYAYHLHQLRMLA